MFAASVPSYVVSSGFSAQQSRRHGGNGRSRLSQASDTASLCSSAASISQDSDDDLALVASPPTSEIKEVLGYVQTPPRHKATRNFDTPRLVQF
ncbi:hypothetical protein H4R21_002942 [Coemansia helicoidea]|uniref:Uncharacterized protein n=1 Tax=Coemansia helicoidea TaxID=1286919 RepID=A0ACC1L4Y7_9FUNG|nr:hypothetical protein H4R21_002942 [Coemansia helicoidea]